ncbi:hypothetical protein FF2_044683 [Malus domestica]
MPTIKTADFIWVRLGNKTTQKIMFQSMLKCNKAVQVADWLLCNSAYDLQPATFTFTPEILPIGPLLASRQLGNSAGYFWPQDSTCLEWLDHQPPSSVIYIAFGSFTIFSPTQFKELALALEFSERPFLWVVQPDITDTTSDPYPEGYQERVASRSRMPLRLELYPEGLSNGVPFLCWPYFAEQFTNESYVCDVWKVGLKFEKNETGITTKEEIKNKLEQLLGDKDFNERALKLKELAIANVEEGGQSNKIFKNFVEWMKS